MSRRRRRARRFMAILLIAAVVCVVLLHKGGGVVERTFYPDKYRDEVIAAAEKYGLSPSLVFAVIHQESRFRPDAVSSAGATGLMQITDSTWEWVQYRGGGLGDSPDDLTDPTVNIDTGCCTLMLLSELFENGDTVLAAYNAGQGNVGAWLQDERYSADGVTLHTIPFKETADYVQKVRRAQKMYQKLYGFS